MKWLERLPKKGRRGSRPRCVLLTDGNPYEVAERLTGLVKCQGIVVSPDDKWMPYGKPFYENSRWEDVPAIEAQLDKTDHFVSPETQHELRNWWLVAHRGARTPTWDIASSCKIEERQGLLLVEAKAHKKELSEQDTCGAKGKNYKQIGRAIAEAKAGLENLTKKPWNLSRDTHYQLSNRFAWAWKLASLGIPVVLLYLGFLNATDMTKPLFCCYADWKRALQNHCNGVVDDSCWEKSLDINGTPLIPLIRVYNQPFDPCV